MLQDLNEKPEDESTEAAVAQPDEIFTTSDNKKPISKLNLIGFGAIVIGGIVLCAIHMRSGPATASAAATTATPAAKSNQTISQFLSSGASDIRNMQASLANTEKQVQVFQNYPSVHQVPLGNLKTNPFAYKGDDKSTSEAAAKRAAEIAALDKSASGLKLQSIMFSSRPGGHNACMINNSLCSVGAQVNEFTIIKISPYSVVVVQGDYQHELKIEK
ncbi:MAG TPA: hypothetical protein VGG19_16140 [Tepidisphaeraceae bacterium]|jgi:hypothetical protein